MASGLTLFVAPPLASMTGCGLCERSKAAKASGSPIINPVQRGRLKRRLAADKLWLILALIDAME
jgi:hypothetical protein